MSEVKFVRYLGLDVLPEEKQVEFKRSWRKDRIDRFLKEVRPGDILSIGEEYTVEEFNDLKKSEFGSTIIVDENRYRINFPVQLFEIVEECINSYDIY